MTHSSRTGWSFAGGLLAGGAVGLWIAFAWLLPRLGLLTPEGASPVPPAATAGTHVPLGAGLAAASAAAALRPPPRPVPAGTPACDFEPLVPVSGPSDGRFTLDAALAGNERVRGYVAASREAARQGRQRDSEVALIVACRLAARHAPSLSVPVADAQARLGQRYLELLQGMAEGELRGRLLERAGQLLEHSSRNYELVLGSAASKTRIAAGRLALLGRLRSEADPDRQPAAPEGPGLAEASAPGWGAQAAALASDPELAQLESDMTRLQAQATSVARDPSGLQRRARDALARRSECRDKACLLQWYAQRRRELLAEF